MITDIIPFQARAKTFRSQPARQVSSPGLLYVLQREFATVTVSDGRDFSFNMNIIIPISGLHLFVILSLNSKCIFWIIALDHVSVMGSEDATTCHIVCIRNKGLYCNI